MASGTAMSRARAAARSVPKSSGHTYTTKLEAPLRSSGPAVKAGIPSMVRKMATPARAMRIVMPAARVRLAKTRSPKRRLGDPAFASMVLTVCCALDSLGGDRIDDRLGLLGEGRRDRGRAGVVCRLLLAFLADHVAQERLDEVGLGLVVGGAGDQVRRQ